MITNQASMKLQRAKLHVRLGTHNAITPLIGTPHLKAHALSAEERGSGGSLTRGPLAIGAHKINSIKKISK